MVSPCKELRLKASPQHQRDLLAVQQIDTRVDQLNHRARNLPELGRLAALTEELSELNTALVLANADLSDLNQQIIRAEGDVATVKARAKRDQDLLDSGSISSGKQLEDLQNEVTSLKRRQNELEDAELELMETAEEIQERITSAAERIEAAKTETASLEATRDEALSEIASEKTGLQQERDILTAQLPADLLQLYSKIRETNDGVGIAELEPGGRCGGCHMQLAPTDLRVITDADADEVTRCEECRTILVRG